MSTSVDYSVVSYLDFLSGMARVAASGLGQVDKPTFLLSAVTDVPVLSKEERLILRGMGRIDRVCMSVLTKDAKDAAQQRDKASDAAIRVRLREGTVHELEFGQRQQISTLHTHMLLLAALCGFLSAAACACFEYYRIPPCV